MTVITAASADKKAVEVFEEPNHNLAEFPAVPTKRKLLDYVGGINDFNEVTANEIQPGMLSEGSATIIVAKTNSGKSAFTYKLCNAIAHGLEFLGHQHSPRPVLYLDRENKKRTLRNFKNWLDLDEYSKFNPHSNLVIWALYAPFGVPLPDSVVALEWVREQKRAGKPSPVIVVDTLSRSMDGDDENDTQHIGKFWSRFDSLVRENCAIIILHHSGKGDSTRTYRGSSDIPGPADYHFVLSNESPSKQRLTKMKLQRVKQREPSDAFSEDVLINISADGQFEAEMPEDESNEKLLTLLRVNDGINAENFEKLAKDEHDIGQTAVRKFLKAKVHSAEVEKRKGKERNSWNYFVVAGR
jgi:archaellum biogenesis ATPase FlaH